MKLCSLERILFILICTIMGFAILSHTTPPEITGNSLFTLNYSDAFNNFVGSKRIQSLQFSSITLNNTPATTVTLNFFDTSTSIDLNSYSLNLPGSWHYITGTKNTLSCNLLFQSTNSTFGLLQFISSTGVLKLLAAVPLANFTQPIQLLVQNLGPSVLANTFFLGENCAGGYINLDPNAFGINSSAISGLYQLGADLTSLTIIRLPDGFSISATTETMQYSIASNSLYKFDPINFQYNKIYNFTSSSEDYTINAVRNRIIITASNSTQIGNHSFNVYMTIYYFLDDPNQGLKIIGTRSVNGTNNNKIITIYCSPQLTKMGFGYIPLNQNTTIIVSKSIDYNHLQITDITPNDQTHFLTTFTNLQGFDFSDYYLIVRNSTNPQQSNPQLNLTGQVVEEAYQFVNNQIVFFRSRNLSTSQDLYDFRRIIVDQFYTNQLVVIDVFNSSSGYQFIQFNYGNLGSVSTNVPTTTPAYINFTVPTNTQNYNSPNSFSWTYFNTASSTQISLYVADNTNVTHLTSTSFTVSGSWTQLAQSQQCQLLKDNSNHYVIYKNMQGTYTQFADITSSVSNFTMTATSKWSISQFCDRFSLDKNILSLTSTSPVVFSPITNSAQSFSWSSIDRNLTTVLFGTEVWTYNVQQNKFIKKFDTSTTILSSSKLITLPGIIAISATSNNSAQVLAYSLSSAGTATNCLNYSNNFTNPPNIQFSQNLTKVLILGSSTAGAPTADMFFIDYQNTQNTNITFPIATVVNPAYTYINLNQKFIYIRQLPVPGVAYNASYPNQQFIYYLSQDLYPQVASTLSITQAGQQIWTKTVIQTTPDGNTYSFQQTLQGSSVIVTQKQVTASQATLNSNNNQGISGYTVNGKIKLCSPGCSDCSTGTCTSCLTGFTFDSSSSICYTCGLNCVTCLSSNPNNCSSCVAGAFLSSFTCIACSTSCITCSGSATSCSQCPPGQYYQSTQCALCPKNCQTCSSQNVCTQCNKGFVVTNSGSCRSCIATCSSCNPSNITQCTSCAKGLQLSGGSCIQCPKNCLLCNNGTCSTCVSGYNPNSSGVCVLNCQLPCATCIDNQPQSCLSCYDGSTLSNNACNIDLTCNGNSSCTSCGQGFNYLLILGQCFPCPTISNCIQCSTSNSYLCSICAKGYYIDSSACSACPTQCLSCTSSSICTSCIVGYTLPDGQTQGQCLQCKSPCASCIGSPNYCATCVDGFTKIGWNCRNNTYVGFTIVLGDSPSNILANIDAIVSAILSKLGQSSTNVQAITFTSIQSGSTVMVGSYTPTSASVTTSSSVLSSSLSGSSLGGFTVTSATVTSYVDGNAQSQNTSSSTQNIGLIIGLSIGIPILVIIIVVLACVIYRRRKVLHEQVIPQLNHKSSFDQVMNGSILEIQNLENSRNENSKAFPSTVWQKQLDA